VPVPWSRSGPSLGFGSAEPWLPQPAHWSQLSVEAEDADRTSMLWLYREALHIRRDLAELHTGDHAWMDLGEEVLAFTRGGRFACVVNFGTSSVELPQGEVLLSSVPLDDGDRLPTDAAAWIRLR
jgi:alpha-glucosidase